MVWAPIYLAVFFGLLVSAMIYFIFFWPAREPNDAVTSATEPTDEPSTASADAD